MMNESIRIMRRPRRAWPPAARTATAVIAMAALTMLAPACSSSPSTSSGSSNAGGSSNTTRSANLQTGVQYAGCMRSNGVPQYPDPTSHNELANGLPKVSLQQLGVSSSQYQSAQNACAHLLPNGGQQSTSGSQADLDAMRTYAQCMRSHGLPTWPDPSYDPTAGWGFDLTHVHGFDPNSNQTDNTMDICNHGLPHGIGVPLSRPGSPG